MTVLAIESSCDETAVAIARGCGEMLAAQLASQAPMHAKFGGVVPEVASRNHLVALPALVDAALAESGCRLTDIDCFAATTGPGLAAALLVGAAAAKGLALGAGKPFMAVNHLEGHLLSPFIGEPKIPPHVALIASGGHTLLFDVAECGRYFLLGRTLDDAAGEAFDKVAKLLGLPYPGGAEIDRLARDGDPARFAFPRSMLDRNNFDFSFSGLKTSVRYLIERESPDATALPDLCASFQEAVLDVLVGKLVAAARSRGRTLVAVSGGVSSNRRLGEKLAAVEAREGLVVRLAAPTLRTDNAAMIAHAALRRTGHSPFDTDVAPNFDPRLGLENAGNREMMPS